MGWVVYHSENNKADHRPALLTIIYKFLPKTPPPATNTTPTAAALLLSSPPTHNQP